MRLAWLLPLMIASIGAGTVARAQAPADDAQEIFATGDLPESPQSFAARPKTPIYRAFLPPQVDLARYFPPPGDQGKQGSCVGWAVGYAARAYYAQALERRPAGQAAHIPSPAYVYNSIKDQAKGCGSGSAIPNALDLLKSGAVSMARMPYDPGHCAPPSPQMQAAATDFRIDGWLAVDPERLDQVKAELAQRNPVVIGMNMRPAFHRLRGPTVYRSSNEGEDGSHAMAVVGYDDGRQAFRVINSWGRRWGDGGYGWVSYEAFARDVHSAYVMRVSRPPEPAPPPAPPAPAPSPGPLAFDFVTCGKVEAKRTAAGLEVKGYVGSRAEQERAADLARRQGASSVAVDLRPWPQCEALMTLDKGLGAAERPRVRIVRPDGGSGALVKGQPFAVEVDSPPWPSYLQVVFIQADGKAVTLLQPDAGAMAATPPNSRLTIGDGRGGGPKFTVSPPFGEEIVVAVASRSPLFAEPLPQTATEREFLTALRRAVSARPDPAMPERTFGADVTSVVTREGP
ncbi:MAG: DUF4384 domain-containing protein [Reyranella sp.]|nr:DUF4384 domain-containing protein [Reyranella sp.]